MGFVDAELVFFSQKIYFLIQFWKSFVEFFRIFRDSLIASQDFNLILRCSWMLSFLMGFLGILQFSFDSYQISECLWGFLRILNVAKRSLGTTKWITEIFEGEFRTFGTRRLLKIFGFFSRLDGFETAAYMLYIAYKNPKKKHSKIWK